MTPILNTDGYKIDHRRQYPKETKLVYSNFTPRKSRVEGVEHVVVFGIQYYLINTLIELWDKEFFNQPFEEVGRKFYRRIKNYTSADAADAIGIEHIQALHTLGYMPLEIKAIPEGRSIPIRVPAYSVKSTVDEFYWLTNYIETDMSCETWGPMTSATTANQYKKIFTKWAMETVGNADFVPFQGHDFSYRGMFGREAAKMSGAAHLTSFVGTDTIPAIGLLEDYYGADSDKELVGCSVFATEHAVMCVGTGFYIKKGNLTWERYGDAEFEVFKRLITELYPTGIVSVVSDTWNLWKVLTDYLPRLKSVIMARDGKLVIRPDSGDPVDIMCGLSQNEWTRDIQQIPQQKGVVELLWDTFGGTVTEKGYRLLDSHIGAIYGDSITPARAEAICSRLAGKDFASINWVAGIGSYTYQYVTRDTYGFAMKATYAEVEIDGERHGIEIFKDPITDDGTKKSARGLLGVFKNEHDGGLYLEDQLTWDREQNSELKIVFRDGVLVAKYTLQQIRENVINQNK
jgi:nicotinamide phosphoribosyltransferase